MMLDYTLNKETSMRNIDLCNEYIRTNNPEFLFDINPASDDVILLKYTGVGDIVEIPSFVTAVSSKVFAGVLGDSLKVIWRDCKCDSLSYMFEETKVEALEVNINTKNVKVMSGMFSNSRCKSIILGDLFDTSSVTAMNMMFDKCYYLEHLDLGKKFYTSIVGNYNSMFSCCESLKVLDLGDYFEFNLSGTTVLMFYGVDKLEVLITENDIPKDARRTLKGGIEFKTHMEED